MRDLKAGPLKCGRVFSQYDKVFVPEVNDPVSIQYLLLFNTVYQEPSDH